MGKKGGLIEDRVIRQPMEQFRRKLKFREKEKRKELNQIKKQSRVSEVDPLLGHDSTMISHLKQGTQQHQKVTEPINQET